MRRVLMMLVAVALSDGLDPRRAAAACAGDCDGDGGVTINELVRAVGIALGGTAVGQCTAADGDADGSVTIAELVGAVGNALGGCDNAATPPPTDGSAATATVPPPATPTPTDGLRPGIAWHRFSTLQHVRFPTENTSLFLYVAVDGQAAAAAQVTLEGPGGAMATIPYSANELLGGATYARFAANPPAIPYVPGAQYTLTSVTSTGTASATFIAPGGITAAADGSQASWAFDGTTETVNVLSPAPWFSEAADRTSPFLIPAEAYGAGLVTYRLGVIVASTITAIDGAAAGSSLEVTDGLYVDVVPAAVGPTFSPTATGTPTATATRTSTRTPSPTFTGTLLPTPALTGEILFTSNRNGGTQVFVMDADGGNAVQLTTGSAFHAGPQWNHDKSRIAFTRDRRLHLMDADGANVTTLRTALDQFDPTFSPDGARIVYAELDASFNTRLVSYELATGQATPLTATIGHDAGPTFSPDGQHIFFTSTRDSTYFEIYRIDADGSNLLRLTTNSDYEQLGEVSPDGGRLAYAARDALRSVSLGIVVAGIDGSAPMPLTSTADPSDDERPLWSPDGAYLAFRPRIDDANRIFRMQTDGTYITDLSPAGASEVASDWR
jgi:TolB protein